MTQLKEKKYLINNNEKWLNKLEELKEFINKNVRLPTRKNDEEKNLANWLLDQKKYYKNSINNNEDGYKMPEYRINDWKEFINDDKYKDYLLTKDEVWLNKLEELKEFIDKYKITPLKKSIDDEEIKLGRWLSGQKSLYNKYINNNEDGEKMLEHRINDWEEFINDDKYKDYLLTKDEIWLNKFQELKKFIDKYKRTPLKKSIDDEEIKLGRWLSGQKSLYNKYINNNEDGEKMLEHRINDWEKFINDDKYKDYFITDDEKWLNKLEELKEFINKNGRLPTRKNDEEENLHNWLFGQKNSYKNLINNNEDGYKMPEYRINDWEEFINDNKYKDYLLTDDEKWLNKLEKLKEFINKNIRLPTSKNDEEIKLGKWLSHQKEYYKNSINNNEDGEKMLEHRINDWEEFINDDKYKDYFITKDEKWLNKFQELKEFIDKNKRTPSTSSKNKIEEKLGKWLSHQKEYYKNLINNNEDGTKMLENRINDWEEFINDDKYKEILLRYSTKYCESEACSLYDYSEKTIARYQINDGRYFCRNCCQHLFPNLIPKLFVRQEHLILAEIQRKIEDNFDNIISLIWDCPISCTLKRPDLLYELDDIYVWFENDESGHEQTQDRLHEITNSLYNKNKKPIILFRINPNFKKRELLKQDKNKEWKSTKHFDKAFEDFINIIKEQLDIFKEYCENDEYDEDYNYKDDDKLYFHEVGFLFNKKDVPKDRGEYIYDKNKYIFYKKLSNTI